MCSDVTWRDGTKMLQGQSVAQKEEGLHFSSMLKRQYLSDIAQPETSQK